MAGQLTNHQQQQERKVPGRARGSLEEALCYYTISWFFEGTPYYPTQFTASPDTVKSQRSSIFKKVVGPSLVAQWLRIACQCSGHGFEPWSRKIPHATEQLSLCATTTEPTCLEPELRNKKSHRNEKPVHCNEE